MYSDKKTLLKARDLLQNYIQKYNEFLNVEIKTFEGRYGAEQYIMMAENRIKEINQELMTK